MKHNKIKVFNVEIFPAVEAAKGNNSRCRWFQIGVKNFAQFPWKTSALKTPFNKEAPAHVPHVNYAKILRTDFFKGEYPDVCFCLGFIFKNNSFFKGLFC